MIALAFDSATDRLSVAASDGSRVAHRQLDGSRGHATAILSLIDAVLQELDATAADVTQLLTGDGPGSFTGLRVATSVAKAMAWGRPLEWRISPSLLIRAAAQASGGGTVLAVSDALRGELYAGCWRFDATGVTAVAGPPRTVRPESLTEFGRVDRVVGSMPPAVAELVVATTGCAVTSGEAALPDARMLLQLAAWPGGTTLVADPAAWEPEYGRPAEAQAVWERKHGRVLPNPPGIAR